MCVPNIRFYPDIGRRISQYPDSDIRMLDIGYRVVNFLCSQHVFSLYLFVYILTQTLCVCSMLPCLDTSHPFNGCGLWIGEYGIMDIHNVDIQYPDYDIRILDIRIVDIQSPIE